MSHNLRDSATQNFLCGRHATVSLAESPAPTQLFSSCSHIRCSRAPGSAVECRSIVAFQRARGHSALVPRHAPWRKHSCLSGPPARSGDRGPRTSVRGSAAGLQAALHVFLPTVRVHVDLHRFALLPRVLHRIVHAMRVPQGDRTAVPRPPAAFAKLIVESAADSCLELL